MKKKIEKIPDDKKYYEESEFVEEVIEKLNQIIDHLNSQVQPEEIDNTKLVMPPSAYDQAEKEGFNMKNKVKSKLLPQDTPEEWEEDFRGFLDFVIEDDSNKKEVVEYVKNLLSERERKVLEHVLMEVKEEDLVDKAVEDYIEGWLYKLKLNKKK